MPQRKHTLPNLYTVEGEWDCIALGRFLELHENSRCAIFSAISAYSAFYTGLTLGKMNAGLTSLALIPSLIVLRGKVTHC